MHSRYLDNPDYTFEKVNRASMACGPMVKWAIAQVQFYCNIYNLQLTHDNAFNRLVMLMY